jgi:hypothetical protein
MYETLTLKNHLSTVIGVIESYGGNIQINFSNSENLRITLEQFISRGVNVKRIVNGSIVDIKANANDSDFLEKLSEYFQYTFDYLPIIKQAEEILSKTSIFQPVLNCKTGYISIHELNPWEPSYDRIEKNIVSDSDETTKSDTLEYPSYRIAVGWNQI